MSKEIVFITGINGSGASYLAEYLCENHPEVEVHGNVRWRSGIDLKNLKNIINKITIHECDLLDLPSVVRVLRKVKPTKIFNMASHANVSVCFDTPVSVLNNNISLMINLLEAIRLECPDVVLQQCSTSEVYGTPKITPITEGHPIHPPNPYAVSKDTQEKLCWAYHKAWGLKIIITRAFAYINPRRKEIFSTAFAYKIAQIEAGKLDVLRHGNLFSTRTLMDVRDMARAYWLASEKCEYGIPYNIGSNTPIEVGEFMMKLIEHAKCHIWTWEFPELMRPVDITNQIPDTTMFNTLTDFTPKYSLDESVDFLLDHVRREATSG